MQEMGERTMDVMRYSRQTAFIGSKGQQKLFDARVAVAGVGALGTVIANCLARAGVGYIRLIDRDIVELSNLQRQTLFTESDARQKLPKAVCACEHLGAVNSDVKLEPLVSDINSGNIDAAFKDIDFVLDGGDNMELRHLVNEWCVKRGVPWIYGGAIQAGGACMAIIPQKTPCFRCLYPDLLMKPEHTCASAGVLNMVTGIIGAYEAAEAVKILLGGEPCQKLLLLDLWKNSSDYIGIARNDECPVCAKRIFTLLESPPATFAARLCGQEAVQITPQGARFDLFEMEKKLLAAGSVKAGRYSLSFDDGKKSFMLFEDGRAIIYGVSDEKAARAVYAEYIGQ
jgi:adenylyltransferase/sulfurtransferase